MSPEKADTCEECDRPLSDDPEVGEWPRSRFGDGLCIPCGSEAFMEEAGID